MDAGRILNVERGHGRLPPPCSMYITDSRALFDDRIRQGFGCAAIPLPVNRAARCMERPISFCAAVADYQETEKSRFCESSPSDLYFWFRCSIIRAFVDTFLSYSSTHNHSEVCRGVVHPFTLTLLYSPPGSEHLHFLGPAASYQSTIVLSA